LSSRHQTDDPGPDHASMELLAALLQVLIFHINKEASISLCCGCVILCSSCRGLPWPRDSSTVIGGNRGRPKWLPGFDGTSSALFMQTTWISLYDLPQTPRRQHSRSFQARRGCPVSTPLLLPRTNSHDLCLKSDRIYAHPSPPFYVMFCQPAPPHV